LKPHLSLFSLVYTFNSCPSEENKEGIIEDVINFVSSTYGVSRLGLLRSFAAPSCDQALAAHPGGEGLLYWINAGNTTQQRYC